MSRGTAKDVRREVLRAAQEEARALGSASLEAEHLLLALSDDARSPTGRLLAESGLDRDALRAALERETEHSLAAVGVALAEVTPPELGTPSRRPSRLAASSRRALERAALVALARKDRRITGPHLLLGILGAEIGTVPRALALAGVERDVLATRAERLLD
jgi:D-alanyl-D-alanine carboxypeptidase